MLGMCFVRTGDYTKALRKFNELLENFPKSQFAEDSRYWRSVCLYYGGQEELAIDSLLAMADENPKRAEEALYTLGELAYQKGEYVGAKTTFLTYLEQYAKGQYLAKVHLRLGQIAWHFEEYEEAARHFEIVSPAQVPREEYYTARILLAQCYIKLNKLDMAQSICDALLKDESFKEHWGDIELVIGDILYARKDIDGARTIWEKIAEKYPRKETGAWAYFRLGGLYFDLGDLDMARKMYDAAAQQVSSGSVRDLALQRSATISKLLAYQQQILAADSLGINPIAAEIALAEMYLTELGQPDSAISTYRSIIERFPEDSLAPKAAYSMGWIYANSKRNYVIADSVFSELLRRFPESDYAVGAADYFKSRGASLDSIATRNVAFYFVKAEEFWLTYLLLALVYYSIVIDSFPQSRWLPKALAAKAEILASQGNVLQAKTIYELISANYRGTPYDSLARVRLGDTTAKYAASKTDEDNLKAGKPQAGDDTITVAAADTSKLTFDNLPRAPLPMKPIRLYYPEQYWSSRFQQSRKVVRLKIKIDPFGKVKEAEVISSCGETVIDDAAVRAVFKAEFDPSKIDITLFNTWFLFEKPARDEVWEE